MFNSIYSKMHKPNTYSRTSPGKYSLWIDFETTGADFGSGVTFEKYQGISFGAVIAENETFEPIETLYCEMQFDESKYQWTEGAEKIHGLSREHLAKNGMPRDEALALLLELIAKYIGAQNKICIAGHNISFDIGALNQLTSEFDLKLDLHHVQIETSQLAFVAIGKYRSDDVFPFFGGEVRGNHNALDDALQSLAVARGIKQLVQAALGAE